MTLVLHRIDDRLIHGQVVVGWGQPLNIQFIVLVDDAVAASEWEQELYRMGVPPEMDVYFLNVADAIAALPRYRDDSRNGILLTGDIETMRRLVDDGGIPNVNLGGIHHRVVWCRLPVRCPGAGGPHLAHRRIHGIGNRGRLWAVAH